MTCTEIYRRMCATTCMFVCVCYNERQSFWRHTLGYMWLHWDICYRHVHGSVTHRRHNLHVRLCLLWRKTVFQMTCTGTYVIDLYIEASFIIFVHATYLMTCTETSVIHAVTCTETHVIHCSVIHHLCARTRIICVCYNERQSFWWHALKHILYIHCSVPHHLCARTCIA